MTTTVTLTGITREVPVDATAVAAHQRAGMTRDQAVAVEAILTLGATLVTEAIEADGIAAGDRLATALEGATFDAVNAVCRL